MRDTKFFPTPIGSTLNPLGSVFPRVHSRYSMNIIAFGNIQKLRCDLGLNLLVYKAMRASSCILWPPNRLVGSGVASQIWGLENFILSSLG